MKPRVSKIMPSRTSQRRHRPAADQGGPNDGGGGASQQGGGSSGRAAGIRTGVTSPTLDDVAALEQLIPAPRQRADASAWCTAEAADPRHGSCKGAGKHECWTCRYVRCRCAMQQVRVLSLPHNSGMLRAGKASSPLGGSHHGAEVGEAWLGEAAQQRGALGGAVASFKGRPQVACVQVGVVPVGGAGRQQLLRHLILCSAGQQGDGGTGRQAALRGRRRRRGRGRGRGKERGACNVQKWHRRQEASASLCKRGGNVDQRCCRAACSPAITSSPEAAHTSPTSTKKQIWPFILRSSAS